MPMSLIHPAISLSGLFELLAFQRPEVELVLYQSHKGIAFVLFPAALTACNIAARDTHTPIEIHDPR